MSLASRYAKVIRALNQEGVGADGAHKLVAYMKNRGHLSYLPQALRMAEADIAQDTAIVVTVAKTEDASRYADQIASALKELGAGSDEYSIVVDEKIVGGTLVVGRGRVIDNSHRTRLVSIYQSVI
ncbi:MAG: F0F1 ATP synthase subunit delta [Patescibacteria group bacterium]